MDRQVIIMQGVSGSGKSTLARRLAAVLGSCRIVSADDLFFGPDRKYTFDPSKIDEAHNECFRKFLRYLVSDERDDECNYVIVDNTNTTAADCAPYMRAASAFGWKSRIIRIACDPKVALERNDDRAPAKVIEGQMNNLEYQRFPAYWTLRILRADDVPSMDAMDLRKVVSDA